MTDETMDAPLIPGQGADGEEVIDVGPGQTLENATPIRIEFLNVSLEVADTNTTKVILYDLNEAFEPGTLTAVMGPSGAGKTTFLNLLTGLEVAPTAGSILINGMPRNNHMMRKYSSLVTQENLLFPTLTPYEALMQATALRLSSDLSFAERQQLVHRTLEEFAILECKNVVAGHPEGEKGLSGGQRKRLSIALEMISRPSLLCLDEPTSGLDSFVSSTVVKLLRDTASRGHTVISTIHQPSATLLNMFDEVMLLVKGEVVFHGPTSDIVPYFQSVGFECPPYENPADFMLEIVGGQSGHVVSQLVKRCRDDKDAREASEGAVKAVVEPLEFPEKEYESSFLQQFYTLSQRAAIIVIRDPNLLRARIGSSIGFGLILGGVFWDSSVTPELISVKGPGVLLDNRGLDQRVGMSFFAEVFILLASVLPTIISLIPERAIFEKEFFNNWYSIGPYLYSKIMCDTPLLVFPTFLLGTITFFMARLNEGEDGDTTGWVERLFLYITALAMQAFVSHAWAYFICAVAPTLSLGVFFAPLSSIPQFLICGFLIHTKDMSTFFEVLSYLAFTRYTYRMTVFAVCYKLELPTLGGWERVLDTYYGTSYTTNGYMGDLFAILGFIIAFRLMGAIAIAKRAHRCQSYVQYFKEEVFTGSRTKTKAAAEVGVHLDDDKLSA